MASAQPCPVSPPLGDPVPVGALGVVGVSVGVVGVSPPPEPLPVDPLLGVLGAGVVAVGVVAGDCGAGTPLVGVAGEELWW